MAHKCVDGYHDNKSERDDAYGDDLLLERISGDKRYFGMEIEFEFDPDVHASTGDACWSCDGNGQHYDEDTDDYYDCDDCGGSGYQSDSVPDVLNHIDFDNDIANMFYFEQDGSLDYGFELITEPMTLKGMTKFLGHKDIRSFISLNETKRSNGVHIHVSRGDDFGQLASKKLMLFMTRYGELLENYTRNSGYAKWFHKQTSPGPLLNYLAGVGDGCDPFETSFRERHNCVNFTGNDTIEFRFFNSTNSVDRLKLYLNLANNLMDIATTCTVGEIYISEFIFDPTTWTFTKVRTGVVETINSVKNKYANIDMYRHPVFLRAGLRAFNGKVYDVGDKVQVDLELISDDELKAHTDYCRVGVSVYMSSPSCEYGVIDAVRFEHSFPVYHVSFKEKGERWSYNHVWLDRVEAIPEETVLTLDEAWEV